MASVAKRYRVSASQVAQWNKVSTGARFAQGQKIVVYVPARSAKSGRPSANVKSAKTSRPAKSGRGTAKSTAR